MRSTSPESVERVRRAQERALRAARAVTLTMTAVLAGCASTVDGSVPADVVQAADTPAVTADTPAPDVAVAVDAATPVDAVDVVEASDVAADVGDLCSNEGDAALSWSECCDRINWDWRRGCQAWGPFMPPSMQTEAA
jgi:hypothetical protein